MMLVLFPPTASPYYMLMCLPVAWIVQYAINFWNKVFIPIIYHYGYKILVKWQLITIIVVDNYRIFQVLNRCQCFKIKEFDVLIALNNICKQYFNHSQWSLRASKITNISFAKLTAEECKPVPYWNMNNEKKERMRKN